MAAVLGQVAGIAAVTFVAGEVAARWVLSIHPVTPGDQLWEHHPRWGWRHEPNAEDTYAKLGCRQHIRINSLGLREREIPYQRQPGVARVLAIGDSGVVGFEVAQEDVWTRIAELTLRKRGYRVEFINAGVRGYGTDQSLLFLMDEGVKYRPDLVIYTWNDNDFVDNLTVHLPFRKFGKGYFDHDAEGSLLLRGAPVPVYDYGRSLMVGEDGLAHELEVPFTVKLRMWLRDNIVSRSAFGTAVVHVIASIPWFSQTVEEAGSFYHSNEGGLDRTSRAFRLTVDMIREMDSVSRAMGTEFRIIPDGELSLALSEQAGVHILDPWPEFKKGVPDGAELIVPYDTHWNALGHKIFGEAVAEAILMDSASPRFESDGPSSEARPQTDEAEPLVGRRKSWLEIVRPIFLSAPLPFDVAPVRQKTEEAHQVSEVNRDEVISESDMRQF